MSVRFTAAGEELKCNMALGSISQYTLTMWAKTSVDTNTYTTMWQIDQGSTGDLMNIGSDTDGTSLIVADETKICTTGIATVVGTWYFVATSVNGTTGTFVVRALGAASSTVRTWTAASATVNAAWLRLGNDHTGLYLNGCVTAVKLWTGVALTQAEMEAEMWTYAPKRLANLKAWYPLLTTETADYSGNGLTLTGGVGATAEDGPAIGWSQRGPRAPIKDTIEIAVGQASSTETAGVILQRHTVGMAVETNTARSTRVEVIVDTVTEINLAAEIVDPIAIGVTALTASSAAVSAQSWSTASVAPTGNRLLLLCVAWAASTAVVANPIASVTGNGLTWVLLRGQNYGAATGTINARHRMEVWRALGPAPTAGAITITHAAAQPGINRCWSVFEVNSTDLSGTSGSGAVRQNAVNLGTAVTTATATLGAFGSAFNATFGFGAGGSAMSIGAGFTAIATQLVSTPAPATSLITEWFLGTDTTVNASQTTAGQFGIIGFEIKRRFVEPLTGPPFETDLAQAITRRKTRTLGIASETDAARVIVGFKTKAVGQTALTNTAQAITRVKVRALGMATSTHAAQALSRLKMVAVGLVTGTELAQAIAKLKVKALGLTTEADAAQVLTRVKSRVVAQATETEFSRALATAKLKAIAMATSTMAARAVSAVRVRAISLATEADAARAMGTVVKSRLLGMATGSNAAQALTRLKTLALSRATTSDLARALTRVKARVVGQATGTHTATALTKAKALLVSRAGDTSLARTVAAVYVKAIGTTLETGLARALTTLRTLVVGRAAELGSALAISSRKTLSLAQAGTTEAARIIGRARGIVQALETTAATALATIKAKAIALAAETGLAAVLGTLKRLAIATATGLETARLIGLERGLIQVVEPNHADDVISQPTLSAPVGQASATDAAQVVTFVFTKIVAVGQVTITNTALSLTPARVVPVTLVIESNTAQTIRRLLVDQVTESDTALTVIWRRPGAQIDLEGSSGPVTGTGSSAVVYLVGEGQDVSLQSVLDPIDLDGSY